MSARNLSLNVLIEHDAFQTPYSRLNVHGSWVRAAFHTVRTVRSGRLLQVFFHAIDPHRVVITEGCSAPYCRDNPEGRRHVLAEGVAPFVAENVKVSLHHKELSLIDSHWHTTSTSTVGAPHVGKLRMNIAIKPTYAVDYDAVAPQYVLAARDSNPILLCMCPCDSPPLSSSVICHRTVGSCSARPTIATLCRSMAGASRQLLTARRRTARCVPHGHRWPHDDQRKGRRCHRGRPRGLSGQEQF